ncbi:MAG: hypothetical protein VKK04_12755 [Synechococcales bacterium]|nr:hypothetical protein [Synechococcales bacterium]
MNRILNTAISTTDGQYLVDQDLKAFQKFIESYTLRRDTYLLLQEQADALVLTSLRRMMAVHRATIQEHGDKCKRDMGYVLRYAALCLLKDDEDGFVEQLVLWMQTVMAALHKEQQSAEAYRMLQTVLLETLPAANAALINHYLDVFIDALMVSA